MSRVKGALVCWCLSHENQLYFKIDLESLDAFAQCLTGFPLCLVILSFSGLGREYFSEMYAIVGGYVIKVKVFFVRFPHRNIAFAYY